MMHPKLEEKFNEFLIKKGMTVNKIHMPKHYIKTRKWFKIEYLKEKYNIPYLHLAHIRPFLCTYNWIKDCPTNKFLILLAMEKI